jgi:hypothetical protein
MATFPPVAKGYRPRCYFDVEVNGVSGMVFYLHINYTRRYIINFLRELFLI